MGDRARFSVFAEAIEHNFPDRDLVIADVASGKGGLQAALLHLGYREVIAWDTRRRNAGPRRHVRYGLFDHRNAPRGYDLVVGMHPDGATDEIVLYAAKHRRPFMVVPCCVVAHGAPYGGARANFVDWMRHLAGLARAGGMVVEMRALPMGGRNQLLVGRPRRRP